jgi:hypothetical protein
MQQLRKHRGVGDGKSSLALAPIKGNHDAAGLKGALSAPN